MTRYTRPAIQGEAPWGRNDGGGLDDYPREAAPSKQVAYQCEKGCAFTVTLAAEAKPRADWDCRCGSVAHLDAPDDTAVQAGRPGYGEPPGGYRKGDKAEGMDPWGQYLKRRGTVPGKPGVIDVQRALAWGERLFNERLAELKQTGAAR